MIWRLAGLLVALGLLAAVVQWGVRQWWRAPSRMAAPVVEESRPAVSKACAADPTFDAAATANAASLDSAPWSVFGVPEAGWSVYAELVAKEIGTDCPPQSPVFAKALADWQQGHKLASDGQMRPDTLDAMRILWLRRRSFTAQTQGGTCPAAAVTLAGAGPHEGYKTKPIQLTPGALEAYRAMVRQARASSPEIAGDPQLLTIFSGFRAPDAEPGVGSPARARCSAHRTGNALDLYLGAAPGFAPESSADENRRFQARSAAYRWLVRNAGAFGFTPYPYEPWHWEWNEG